MNMDVFTVEDVAEICHAANRRLCKQLGDDSQAPWENAPEWQQHSAIQGVNFHLDNPDATPADSHESWMREKHAEGWTYGPEKNPDIKQHPCMVPFDQLPPSQQAKDHLFRSVVHGLAPFILR